MKLEDVVERVEKYIKSEDTHPRLVDIPNIQDLSSFKQHFNVGSNVFLELKDFCSNEDENPQEEAVFNYLSAARGNIFITELLSFWKLYGDDETKRLILRLLQYNSADAHIIVVAYKCSKYLRLDDIRTRNQIYYVDGDETKDPSITFIPKVVSIKIGEDSISGVSKISYMIENKSFHGIYVKTNKRKSSYPNSIYVLAEESSAYDVLKDNVPEVDGLNELFGTDSEWQFLLEEITKLGHGATFTAYIQEKFGTTTNLEVIARNWKAYDKRIKWLFFTALKMYGAKNNWTLDTAARKSDSADVLMRQLYRSILELDVSDKDFWNKYDERKCLIKAMDDAVDEALDYSNMVKIKGREALYFLTDNTQIERETIFELLDEYGTQYSKDELMLVLKHVYPDLYCYLRPYKFNNDLLDTYFQDYKYQKVINKLLPEFEAIVEEQAVKRDYNRLLPFRAEKTESIPKKGTDLYFVDAMGAEFLGYIMSKAGEYDLQMHTTVCRCELPSITSFNKEFIEVFEQGGANIIPSIKDIDTIKHKGENSFDYTVTKLPIYLAKELDIIDELLKRIKVRLMNGSCDRVVMIADHGATRMAVLKNNIVPVDCNSRGAHGGRVCDLTEDVSKVDFATESNGYYVLANYSRFRGGRPASVEVHGGATLEEITVPIIELNLGKGNIEITVSDVVRFNKRKHDAVLSIFSKTKLDNVSVVIDRKRYKAKETDGQSFTVELPDLNKKGTYLVDVYSNDVLLASDIPFKAEVIGMTETNLL